MFRQRLRHTFNIIETQIFKKQTIEEVLQKETLNNSFFNHHSKKEDNPSEILFDVDIDKDYLIGSFDDIPSNINAHGSVDSNSKSPAKRQEKKRNTFEGHGQGTFGDLDHRDPQPSGKTHGKGWSNEAQRKKVEKENHTFFNPDCPDQEKKGSFKKTYLEDWGKKTKDKSGQGPDDHEKTFDISNIPIIASASENSLLAKPNAPKKKPQKKTKTDFFEERYETLKNRQLIDKKIKSSKKNIIPKNTYSNNQLVKKEKNNSKRIKKDFKEKFQKRERIQDMIFSKHSSEKNLFSAKKRATKMARRESRQEIKEPPQSPKNNMFLLNDFNEFHLGDSVCDNAIFISNKFDFMAIGGRSSRKLKFFSFENNNFHLDCELKIFKSEPTDIHFYGKTNPRKAKAIDLRRRS